MFVFGAWIAIKLALGSRAPRRLRAAPRARRRGSAVGGRPAYAGFWLIAILLAAIFGTPDDQALVTDIKAENSIPILLGCGVLICVLAPVAEELFFRGFMFTVSSARRLGRVPGARCSPALVFGLGHAPAAPIQLIALGAFGVGLCLLYWRTGSIIPVHGPPCPQ